MFRSQILIVIWDVVNVPGYVQYLVEWRVRGTETMAESRQGAYLARQSRTYSEGEAVESSRRGWVRLHGSISIHPIDIREPEVFLQRQPNAGIRTMQTAIFCTILVMQSKEVGTTTPLVSVFEMNMDVTLWWTPGSSSRFLLFFLQ